MIRFFLAPISRIVPFLMNWTLFTGPSLPAIALGVEVIFCCVRSLVFISTPVDGHHSSARSP